MPKGPDLIPLSYRRPLLQGAARMKYAALFFWQWWFQPGHFTSWVQYGPVTLCVLWVFFVQAYFIALFMRAQNATGSVGDLGGCRVAMIVTKAPSEPFSIVRITLQAMLAQDVPHDTWLADEDPDQETLDWCFENGVKVSTRKDVEAYHSKTWPRRTRCKEGNLAYFYDHYGYENYDFVSQLDADHVPQPNYLKEILRPFADPGVGYVSAPSICSLNSQKSWAARSRLHTEAVFHGVVQAGYANGWAPMCIGSHYAVRTKALQAVGGLGPELAEDHSTSMILNAGGWKGMHAMDAIAYGEGPATVVDMIVQEFQWSRSLLTILLQYTPRYFSRLSGRQRLQFVFCQLWYPLLASFMALMFALPILALAFDIRYVDVTFPAFIAHVWPSILVMVVLIWCVRSDGFFRPRDAKVLGWEKMLFAIVQWPWVILGSVMAIRDSLFGGFVDFRVTPKGDGAFSAMPWAVLVPYAALALVSLLPVLLIEDITNAAGFYVFALINAGLYTLLFLVIVVNHLRESGVGLRHWPLRTALQFVCVAALAGFIFVGFVQRGNAALVALSTTEGPVEIYRPQFVVSGAGRGSSGNQIMTYNPDWYYQLFNPFKAQRSDP